MAGFAKVTGLAGLLDLAQRDGVDVRPTMLRVLTDLYVQSPAHAPEDERYYTELALRLIDVVDIPARAALANRLATYPAAPRALIVQLARDVLDVAEPILRHARLTPEDLKAIVADCGAGHAGVIALRGESVPTSPDDDAASVASGSNSARAEAAELCELFFAAGGPERRLILTNLDFVPTVAPAPRVAMQRADVWRLESAALKHETDTVVRELERALGISGRMARRFVADDLGEPVVVAAKAMNLPADVLQRMLLFMNPRVGESIDRVYELAALYNEISVDAARRLIAILRDADPVGLRRARHDPLLWHDAAETARQTLSELARPAARGRDTLDVARDDRAVKEA